MSWTRAGSCACTSTTANSTGTVVLAPRTARDMRRLDYPGKPFDHGIGWFRRPTNGTGDWVEHFGAGAGFWNVMRLYPDRGVGVVVMANTTSRYDFEPLFGFWPVRPDPQSAEPRLAHDRGS